MYGLHYNHKNKKMYMGRELMNQFQIEWILLDK